MVGSKPKMGLWGEGFGGNWENRIKSLLLSLLSSVVVTSVCRMSLLLVRSLECIVMVLVKEKVVDYVNLTLIVNLFMVVVVDLGWRLRRGKLVNKGTVMATTIAGVSEERIAGSCNGRRVLQRVPDLHSEDRSHHGVSPGAGRAGS